MSHPVWVCGLKHSVRDSVTCCGVTPCMGVWIETCIQYSCFGVSHVTPCMGVWIETGSLPGGEDENVSHPVWVCGLKP